MEDTYIQQLTEEEKLVFMRLFCVIVKADGKIENDEISFLKEMAKKYGVSGSVMSQIVKDVDSINYRAEAAKITNRKHALELLKELCLLSNIDGDLHDTELDILISISRAMNIEDEKLLLINRFVLDAAILEQTGNIILEK